MNCLTIIPSWDHIASVVGYTKTSFLLLSTSLFKLSGQFSLPLIIYRKLQNLGLYELEFGAQGKAQNSMRCSRGSLLSTG